MDERVLRKRGQNEGELHAELAAINLSLEEASEDESDAIHIPKLWTYVFRK